MTNIDDTIENMKELFRMYDSSEIVLDKFYDNLKKCIIMLQKNIEVGVIGLETSDLRVLTLECLDEMKYRTRLSFDMLIRDAIKTVNIDVVSERLHKKRMTEKKNDG